MAAAFFCPLSFFLRYKVSFQLFLLSVFGSFGKEKGRSPLTSPLFSILTQTERASPFSVMSFSRAAFCLAVAFFEIS